MRHENAAATAMEVPATNHAIFKIWKARSPQMHLIFLSHCLMPLIWRILRLFWRGGVLKPSFSSRKAEIANSNTTGKLSAHNHTNPVEWHTKFIRSIIHAPSLSFMIARRRWNASQAWGERVMLWSHDLNTMRRRSEQGNYTQAVFNYIIYLYWKGHVRGLTEKSLVTLG